jgi:hypothetical protein
METTVKIEDLRTVREVAAQIGKPEYDVRYLIRTGKLRVVRVGYNLFIPAVELEKLEGNGRTK